MDCICINEWQLNPDCPIHGYEQPNPECEYCQGSGCMDSGGTTPWGAPISIRCNCTYKDQGQDGSGHGSTHTSTQ